MGCGEWMPCKREDSPMRQPYEPLVAMVLLLITMLLPSAWACGLPLTYSAEAIEAWVVDEDTGQPLEGVIVVAHWQLEGGLHRDTVGELMVMETISDVKGRFYFPVWGPKLRGIKGYLGYKDPELLLFKSGYSYVAASNRWNAPVDANSLRHSDWNDKTLTLKKFQGSLEEYAKELWFLDETIDFAFFRERSNCGWQKIPHLLVAMHLEAEKLHHANIPDKPRTLEAYEGRNEPERPKCGLVKEFLRSYLQ
jgi:hypothetical protein